MRSECCLGQQEAGLVHYLSLALFSLTHTLFFPLHHFPYPPLSLPLLLSPARSFYSLFLSLDCIFPPPPISLSLSLHLSLSLSLSLSFSLCLSLCVCVC